MRGFNLADVPEGYTRERAKSNEMTKKNKDKIAKEIHDQFLPNLMSIIYEIEFWEKTASFSGGSKEFLFRIKENLENAVKESRKLLLLLNPPRIVEKSLPKALDYYLKRLKASRGLKYRWITSPPDRQTYANQDVLLISFLELLANLPRIEEEILFAFYSFTESGVNSVRSKSPIMAATRPLAGRTSNGVKLAFSWSGLKRDWLTPGLKAVLQKRLTSAGGKIAFYTVTQFPKSVPSQRTSPASALRTKKNCNSISQERPQLWLSITLPLK